MTVTAASRRPGRLAGVLLAAAALAAGAVALAPSARGYALYHGWLPVAGRVDGHASDLPAGAARCAGCHEAPRPLDAGYRSIPPLDGTTLVNAAVRRAGPPSAYDLAAFCRLLRDGTDPAFILIDRTMPRFDLSDGDCAALWTFVSRR